MDTITSMLNKIDEISTTIKDVDYKELLENLKTIKELIDGNDNSDNDKIEELEYDITCMEVWLDESKLENKKLIKENNELKDKNEKLLKDYLLEKKENMKYIKKLVKLHKLHN